MRWSLIIVAVFVPSLAIADRSATFELGLTGDVRAQGSSFSAAGASNDLSTLAGLQLVVGFERAPLAIPEPGGLSHELRLVPELLAGFVADSSHAEGFAGAGLRGELQLAVNRQAALRVAMYVAARAIAIGAHQDGAAEFVAGEYLTLAHGNRFGWEGGAMIRPRSDVPADQARELDTVLTIYYGWQ
ncbi:MAG TPA: hypothetical protein VGG28_02400 [Kofleriaceae bacterium]